MFKPARIPLCIAATFSFWFAAGCNNSPSTPPDPAVAQTALHPVLINQPPKLTSLETANPDPRGEPTRVPCATCHSLRKSNPLPDSPEQLTTFHQNLKFSHGATVCRSCHLDGRHDRLHLADGTPLPMTNVVRLCAQCHGPQYRDYLHGSHGGMRGYWDLKRGPRQRNNCVDCHDPHAPQIPMVTPVLPPRDRFVTASHEEEGDTHE